VHPRNDLRNEKIVADLRLVGARQERLNVVPPNLKLLVYEVPYPLGECLADFSLSNCLAS
jgi:hypothetical protein